MATASPARRWLPPLSYLPRALLEPDRPLRALGIAWLTTLLPTLALGALVGLLLPDLPQPEFALEGGWTFVLVVIAAPIAETVIMAGWLAILLRFVSPTVAVLISAVSWGLLHSAAAPAWGLVIWWPFVIFSTLFVVWRERSVSMGLVMAAAAHALHNLLPTLAILAGADA